MPNFRRNLVPGGTFFFTVVTHLRRPILTTDLGRRCLREAISTVRESHPFELFANVLLPDHWHGVWMLPRGDDRYPLRWMRIKEEFTERWLAGGGDEAPQSESRSRHRLRGIWQKRYWEHTVRDEADHERCVDYIHWNPRKHGLVARIRDWDWSSFHRFVKAGQYDINWGGTDPTPGWSTPEMGRIPPVGCDQRGGCSTPVCQHEQPPSNQHLTPLLRPSAPAHRNGPSGSLVTPYDALIRAGCRVPVRTWNRLTATGLRHTANACPSGDLRGSVRKT
jgi:putative transposase